MLADLDHAIALKPDYAEALVDRARVRLARGNPAGAKADAAAASAALDKANGMKLVTAALLSEVDDQPAAIADYDGWIATHPDDSGLAAARNGRCWARALGNVDLPRALADCNAALKITPRRDAVLDSRGLVYLRMANYPAAIADYDAALAINPKLAWALYGRGLAKLRSGDKAGGEADIAAAKASAPKLADRAAKYALLP